MTIELLSTPSSASEPVATLPALVASINDLDAFRHGPWGAPQLGHPANMRTLWAPYDKVHEALVALVNSARRSLIIGMFGFTDHKLAEAVMRKLNDPNIFVQITLDSRQAAGPTEKKMLDELGMLDSNRVVVGNSEHGDIMHRKIMIVDGLIRASGSTNWSLAGEQKQDNELTIVFDAVVAAEARAVLDLEHNKALTKAGR
jgi:phosphatidylserine/phosphatidylglycerophosphate/cardiolipin synthase-like enzyme